MLSVIYRHLTMKRFGKVIIRDLSYIKDVANISKLDFIIIVMKNMKLVIHK